MPAVSVLLPVFNGERYLHEAIQSVLSQTFADFELLLLDDGSTDRSLSIGQEFAGNDMRVRVISRENRGLVASLNELLEHAQSELFARMDADDVCLPDRLQRQVDYLRSHADTVCVGGDVELIDERGRFLTVQRMLEHDEAVQREALKGHTTICHPCAMYRRASILAVGGYRLEFYPTEDLDLWLRLGELGLLANLPGPILRYRLHGGSISGNSADAQREAARRACAEAWRRRKIPDGQFAATDQWRPSSDRRSQHRFLLQYGWWAFNSGERQTSLVYGFKAVRHLPLSVSSWRLLICAAIKPMKRLRRVREVPQ